MYEHLSHLAHHHAVSSHDHVDRIDSKHVRNGGGGGGSRGNFRDFLRVAPQLPLLLLLLTRRWRCGIGSRSPAQHDDGDGWQQNNLHLIFACSPGDVKFVLVLACALR